MKRIYTSASIATVSLLASATSVFATSHGSDEQSPVKVDNPFDALQNVTISDILTFIINAAFVIAAILALIYLIWGGIAWITSGGDSEGVANARNRIIAAIIGLVIVILAYFVLNFILGDLIGVGNLQDGLDFQSLSEISQKDGE